MSSRRPTSDIGTIKPMLRKFSKSSSTFMPEKPETKYTLCGQCLDEIETIPSIVAYCKQCKDFICSTDCLKQHARNRLTKSHSYLVDQGLKDFLARDGKLSTLLEEETDESKNTALLQNANLRLEFNIRSDKDREICSIHSTVVLPNGNLVLADLKNSNLKLYDPKVRKCLSVLALSKGTRDICISNIKDNHIYAVESGVLGIHVIRVDGNLELVSTIPCTGECFGITYWKRGIAVVMSTFVSCFGEYQLALLDYEGTVRRKFIPKKYPGLELNLPWYMCSKSSGQHVLISDYGSHKITCIDVDGGVLFVYKDEDLVRPVSMATGGNDDIFIVGQRSHNIHHISASGDKKGVVYSENALEYPGGIAYDKLSDQFYMQGTGWSDVMQVFRFGVKLN